MDLRGIGATLTARDPLRSRSRVTIFISRFSAICAVIHVGSSRNAGCPRQLIGRSCLAELSNPVVEGVIRAFQLLFSFDREILSITLLTIRVSGIAVLIGTLIGMPIGGYLGFIEFHGKRIAIRLVEILMRSIVNTFMGLPPVLVGLVGYLLLSASGPLGFLGLLYSPEAMILAQIVMVTPIVAGVSMSAIGSVDRAVRDKAVALGATPTQAFLVMIREARLGLLTAIIVGFGAAISEVGGILIVGGNIRWVTRTLTTAIVYETELGEFGLSIALGIILLSLAFAVNLALTLLQIRQGRK